MPLANWMPIGATLTAAMMMGVGLGSFVTSQPRSAVDDEAAHALYDPAIPTQTDDLAVQGPVEVKCTGCGPTLEERRWRADMAGVDAGGGASESPDRVVRDYYARLPADDAPVAEAPVDIAASVDPLPDNVARFARGESAGPAPQHLPDAAMVETPPTVRRTAALQ